MSAAPRLAKDSGETGGIRELILLERYRSFAQFIDGMSKRFKETTDALTGFLESSADFYRRIRVSAATGIGSIIIPALLALAALDHAIVDAAIALSAVSIIAAGVLTLWTTFKIDSFTKRRDEIDRESSHR